MTSRTQCIVEVKDLQKKKGTSLLERRAQMYEVRFSEDGGCESVEELGEGSGLKQRSRVELQGLQGRLSHSVVSLTPYQK
jgi:hypothetical protein